METTTDTTTNKLSAIEKAIAAAKARKAAAQSVQPAAAERAAEAPKKERTPKAAKEPKDDSIRAASKAARDAERAVKKAQLDADREARKAARASKKATKASEKQDAARKPAHMKKVERAAAKLPPLNDSAQLLFSEAVGNFSADQLTAIALHLQHHNRVMATQRAVSTKLEVGMQVRIIGGDPKFVGLTGTVDEVRRIRCYVSVPGQKNRIYSFTSDVEVVEAQAAQEVAEVG
jgi:transcription antitermination factor NusG